MIGDICTSMDQRRDLVGYVEQFDTLLGSFTVYEMLLYTGELRLPTTITLEEKKLRVTKALEASDSL